LPWLWYEDSQPTEVIRSGKKKVKYGGNWWTNEIDKFEIQLKPDAVRYLSPSFNVALRTGKPFTFFIVPGKDSEGVWKPNRAKWRRITAGNDEEFYLSVYGEDVWTGYDPEKVTRLKTNSVSTYYNWNSLPASLKRFILNENIAARAHDPFDQHTEVEK